MYKVKQEFENTIIGAILCGRQFKGKMSLLKQPQLKELVERFNDPRIEKIDPTNAEQKQQKGNKNAPALPDQQG